MEQQSSSRPLFERILFYMMLVAVLILVLIQVFQLSGNPKIAFVDISKLSTGYRFKKDLEGQSANNLSRIKTVIDSFEMVRKVGAATLAMDTMEARAKYAFRQYYEQSNLENTKKVWERLNPVLDEYGKEKKLQLIIGATGTGTVLYGDKGIDITDDVIQYANAKYEKGK